MMMDDVKGRIRVNVSSLALIVVNHSLVSSASCGIVRLMLGAYERQLPTVALFAALFRGTPEAEM